MFLGDSNQSSKATKLPAKQRRGLGGRRIAAPQATHVTVADAEAQRAERAAERRRQKSATQIQAFLRGRSASVQCKASLRAAWDAQPRCAAGGARALSQGVLRPLLFFAQPHLDGRRLREVVELVTGSLSAEGGDGGLRAQLLGAPSELERKGHAFQLQRLGVVSVGALAAAGAAGAEAAPHLKLLLLLTDTQLWGRSGASPTAAALLCWQTLLALSRSGLNDALAGVVAAQLLSDGRRVDGSGTRLCVGALVLSLRVVGFSEAALEGAGEGYAAQRSAAFVSICRGILSVPDLASRLPESAVAILRIQAFWRGALTALAAQGEEALVGSQSDARCAALLGNMLSLAELGGVDEFGRLFRVVYALLPLALAPLYGAGDQLWPCNNRGEPFGDVTGEEMAGGGDAACPAYSGLAEYVASAVTEHIEQLDAALTAVEGGAEDGVHQLAAFARVLNWAMRRTKLSNDTGPWIKILNKIAFRSGGKSHLPRLWSCVRSDLASGKALSEDGSAMLLLFCQGYCHLLRVQMDDDIYGKQMPFEMAELVRMTGVLNEMCVKAYIVQLPGWQEARADTPPAAERAATQAHMQQRLTDLLSQLHSRDDRRRFCPAGHWVSPLAVRVEAGIIKDALAGADKRSAITLLRSVPWCLPFETRAKIFHARIREHAQDEMMGQQHAQWVRIRRDHIFEDARSELAGRSEEQIRQKIRVLFVDQWGKDEAGIDGGGVFKEFMHEVVKEGFGHKYALFQPSPTEQLYPNPKSHLLGESHLQQFEFLGLVIGKALWESLLVELPLADFFLKQILGRVSFVDDLASLDPDLAKNLSFLKTYDGDVADLSLNFTAAEEGLGQTNEVPLVPNGENIQVTSENRIQYIYCMANHRLNHQIRNQTRAFLQGLQRVVPKEWLAAFSPSELHVMISGSREHIDLADWKANTNYSGGYNAGHPVIEAFWRVVESLAPEEQSELLRFASSSSRAPLLGFCYLEPRFTIHRAEGKERLPTAATCMNLLKLPAFDDEQTMIEKLKLALTASSGFDLS